YGYWSLVAGLVAGPAIATILSYWIRPCGFRVPGRELMSRTLTFSTDILIARLGWYWYENADFVVVAWLLGPSAAGAYWIAWTVATIPIEKIGALASAVALPF